MRGRGVEVSKTLFRRKFLDFPVVFVEKNLLFSYACTKLRIQVVESGTKWFEMVQKWHMWVPDDRVTGD